MVLPTLALPDLDETHVWQLYLPDATRYKTEWSAWLSADEQERAQRFYRERDRDRFQLSRGGLRYLLSRYLTMPPASCRFSYSRYGKPSLVHAPAELYFNLAHSGQWIVYGFSHCPFVGVDVEQVTQRDYLESLIRRCLTPTEQATLPTAPSDRLTAFFEYWTIKEAHLKAVGLGLSYPVADVHVSWHPTPHLAIAVHMEDTATTAWTVNLWCPDRTAIAAACVGQLDGRFTIRAFPSTPDRT